MPWPQTVDYNSAIQNPRQCFADPELTAGEPAEGMIPGIPLSYAGSFATVYKIQGAGSAWAVKCFTRKVENLTLRYKEISAHLTRSRRRFAVEFQYLEQGIHIEDHWYPVVKMQWVEGKTLNEFLRDRVGNTGLLEQLCQLWLRLGAELRKDRMAHGDLQHGNVMLVPGSTSSSILFRLVDYDGMWVPALAHLPPNEVGHPNYQHPQRLREGGYSDEIDRFSHLAIYTALRCLMVGGKALWSAHDNEENVLFREADFKNPARSKLFAKLLALPDANAAALAGHLLLTSQRPLDEAPLVSDLLAGTVVAPLTAAQRDRLANLGMPVPGAAASDWFTGESAVVAPADVPTKSVALEATAAAPPPTLLEVAAVRESAIVPVEQRRAAAELFAHASVVVGTTGDYTYAQHLLFTSCKLDPTNTEHRKLLREMSLAALGGKRNSLFGSLASLPARGRMRAARHAGNHRKVLEFGEELLARAPGDVSTQIEMANSAEALGWQALAVWLLKEAVRDAPADATPLRALANLCERLERFNAAVSVWLQVLQLVPADLEAGAKIKDLSARDTIARTASVV